MYILIVQCSILKCKKKFPIKLFTFGHPKHNVNIDNTDIKTQIAKDIYLLISAIPSRRQKYITFSTF